MLTCCASWGRWLVTPSVLKLEVGIGALVVCCAVGIVGAVMVTVLTLVIFRNLLTFDGVSTPLELRKPRYTHGQIVHGLGLLQSAHLGQLSMAFLSNVVKKHIRRPPEPQDLANYLCGSMEGAFANESPDISNI